MAYKQFLYVNENFDAVIRTEQDFNTGSDQAVLDELTLFRQGNDLAVKIMDGPSSDNATLRQIYKDSKGEYETDLGVVANALGAVQKAKVNNEQELKAPDVRNNPREGIINNRTLGKQFRNRSQLFLGR